MNEIKTYETRKIKVMKELAGAGVHWKIALKTIGENEMWFNNQIINTKNQTGLKEYYKINYAEAVTQNILALKKTGTQSAIKELLSYGFEKELELKEKSQRSKKREPKKDMNEMLGDLGL